MRERETGEGENKKGWAIDIHFTWKYMYTFSSPEGNVLGGGDKVEKAGGWKGRGSLFKIMDQMIL